tara:strand:- start:251 stop:598 length:348 start_codon:yes stop_codon:yes gene_type:complete
MALMRLLRDPLHAAEAAGARVSLQEQVALCAASRNHPGHDGLLLMEELLHRHSQCMERIEAQLQDLYDEYNRLERWKALVINKRSGLFKMYATIKAAFRRGYTFGSFGSYQPVMD